MASEAQPLHNQLLARLKTQIDEQMAPNSKLPSERELALTYGVSRNTVRAALARLETAGVIYRRRGRGTFVANPSATPMDLSATYSFATQMRQQGKEPTTTVVYLRQFPADSYVVDHLHVPLGTPTYKLKRIRSADGIPMMIERTYLPADRFPHLTVAAIEQVGLYDTMQSQYGTAVKDAEEAFYASLVSDYDAKLLKVHPGSPSLSVQRTTTDGNGEVIEFTISVTRADQFVYRYLHRHDGNVSG